MKKIIVALGLLAASFPLAAEEPPATPPVAARKPFVMKAPSGETGEDDYYWLRDDTRKNPEMLGYLAAENGYADRVLAPTKPLQDAIYKEVVGRIKQDDSSVPYMKRNYLYYTRF